MKTNAVFTISEKFIKFIQVATVPKKLVTAVGVINIDQQTDAQVSESLEAFIKLQKLQFTESQVTVVIPRSRAILRYMTFPSHKDDEILSMINLQIAAHIPYVREEVEIDFQILSKSPDGYAKVAVVIIPQDIAMRYWKIFSNSNVPVHGITISSIGLWSLYQQQTGLSDKPGAILDLDFDHTEICLCAKNHWVTSREIPIGVEKMQEQGCTEILNQWDLTHAKIISTEKTSEEVGTVYLASCINRAFDLGLELSKKHPDLTVKEILLTQTLPLAKGVQWPKLMLENGMSLAPLAGIAFRSEPVPINLTPSVVRDLQTQRIFQRQLLITGAWVTAAFVSLCLTLGVGFFRKNLELAQMESRIHDTKRGAFKTRQQLQKIDDIEGMLKGRLIFFDLASELAHLLPAQVYLVNISITDGHTLSMEGVASNPLGVNQLQKDMVNSQSFSNVNLDFVNKRVTLQGEVDYFKITCVVGGAGGQK